MADSNLPVNNNELNNDETDKCEDKEETKKKKAIKLNDYIPMFTALLAAIISAMVILYGYSYEKQKQRDFEINKVRQEIYSRLIKNFTRKFELFEQLEKDDRFSKRVTTDHVDKLYEIISKEYPELYKNFNEQVEIMTLMALYGSDEAIEACVNFCNESLESLQKGSNVNVDPGKYISELRRSIFPKTKINSKDINLIMSK